MSLQHYIAAITQWLRLQQLRNLEHVWRNGFIAQKNRKAPYPINHDPNNAHDDGNVQDEGQRLHDFSGRNFDHNAPAGLESNSSLIILFLYLSEVFIQ